MKQYSRIDQCSRQLLILLYYFARFLGVLNCSFDRQQIVISQMRFFIKAAAVLLRILILAIYWRVLPNLCRKFISMSENYLRLFGGLQIVSVSVFAVCSFFMQTYGESRVVGVLNRFFHLIHRIMTKTHCATLFRGKFLTMLLLKMAITVLGYFNEIPSLLQYDNVLNSSQVASALVGVYLWMGSMFMLDICFLGFLLIAVMYEEMDTYLGNILNRMRYMETEVASQMTRYNCMQQLCDYADNLDDCGSIYSALYELTRSFHNIFQWQILYYIYYNFMVVLLLLHQCISLYIHVGDINMVATFMVVVKIGNLALLIMCADYAVQKSRFPSLICLDVVCSDIDARWDTSVELFLNRRKVENLEINVLGFFQLNNEFILVILSAIISYLFIMIQFGLTGVFEENNQENGRNISRGHTND